VSPPAAAQHLEFQVNASQFDHLRSPPDVSSRSTPKTKPFGEAIKNTLVPHFEKVDEIAVFQMDMRTKQPISGLKVPLFLAKESTGHRGPGLV